MESTPQVSVPVLVGYDLQGMPSEVSMPVGLPYDVQNLDVGARPFDLDFHPSEDLLAVALVDGRAAM